MDLDLGPLAGSLKFNKTLLLKQFERSSSLYQLESNLGGLLRLLSLIGMGGSVVIGLAQGEFIIMSLLSARYSSLGLVFTIFINLWCLSLYWLRDKDRYQGSEHKLLPNLQSRPEAGEVLINDYLGAGLAVILAQYYKQPNFKRLLNLLMSAKLNQQLLSRFGIDNPANKGLQTIWAQQQSNWSEENLLEWLEQGFEIARQTRSLVYDERALMLAMLYDLPQAVAAKFDINKEIIQATVNWVAMREYTLALIEKVRANTVITPLKTVNAAMTSVYAPAVEKYCRDLTYQFSRDNFANEDFNLSYQLRLLREVGEGLSSESGLVLLVGENGVGKSTIINSLAFQILARDVPKSLQDKRLLSLNTNLLLADLKNTSDIAANLQKLFLEQERSGNMILVIDDFDQLLNLQPDLQRELIGILASELRNVKVKLLATLTPASRSKYFEQLPELASLFKVIELAEADVALTVQILLDKLPSLEREYGVKIPYPALYAVAKLSETIDFAKRLPAKALLTLQELLQSARSEGLEFITAEYVEEQLERKLGLKLGLGTRQLDQEEQQQLTDLESEIRQQIIAQDQAVTQVVAALKRSRVGLKKANKPIASFLFYGPTGVGKTELARTIAKVYFGSADLVLRLDMSEYQNPEDLGKLLGEGTGGQPQVGRLSQFVLEHPYSLIILDEIDKANYKILDLFLQVLDNAQLKDSSGRDVSFVNTIIVATSNAGSSYIYDQVKQGKSYKEIEPEAANLLRQKFRVEFLNRFDGVVMFHPLSRADAEAVTTILFQQEKELLREKGIEFVYTDKLVRSIVEQGFNREFGARSIKRKLVELVENAVTDALISGELKPGDIFSLE